MPTHQVHRGPQRWVAPFRRHKAVRTWGGVVTIAFLLGIFFGAALVAFYTPPPVTVLRPVVLSPCEPTRAL